MQMEDPHRTLHGDAEIEKRAQSNRSKQFQFVRDLRQALSLPFCTLCFP